MEMYLYAVKDNAAGSYFAPFMAVNDAVAIRSFNTACRNPGTPIADNPTDYDLYIVAKYDQVNGVITPVEKVIVARGE